jgi:amidohydrolase
MGLKEKIKQLAEEYYEEIVLFRHHLHANPEPSFEEFETSLFIQKQLTSLGIPFEIKSKTGVIAIISGEKPSQKILALRADMDALPIGELNDIPYKSLHAGYMHACGHDVHTASLLGVAKILKALKSSFAGTIKLIFQPGEEKIPGGASLLIAEGVLENPKPDSIIGQHVAPQIPVGKVGFRSGKYMASADELFITVKGKGGHGAMPEQNIDPVLIASHLIIALQQIVSRMANPKMPTVLSFGKVLADGATNIIPDQVYIEGTFRTFDEDWRANALRKMKKMAEMIAEGMGGSCDFHIKNGYPFLVNDPELTPKLREMAVEYLGEENVIDLDLWMAAEDFAYYSQKVPACFYRLGIRNEEKGIVSSVHTPTFNIDENALKIGAGLMSYLALRELGNTP